MLKDDLQKHHFHFKKKFGQNFISDANLLQKIVSEADVCEDDIVIEIGPGAATLTAVLAEKCRHVIAVEIDETLFPIIREKMAPYSNFTLIGGDALTLDFDELIKNTFGTLRRYKVIGNLPYYITTPLVMHLIEQHYSIDRILIMVQKEVADRFCAMPATKEYGAITVALQYYTDVRQCFRVSRKMFTPQPNVDSAIVELRPVSNKYPLLDESTFRQVVRAAFSQRRKTLNNALKPLMSDSNQLKSAFEQANIDPTRRGETLSVEEFAALADAILLRRSAEA